MPLLLEEAGRGRGGLIQGIGRTVHLGNALGSMLPRSSLRRLGSLESVEENTSNDVGRQVVLEGVIPTFC